MYTYNKYNKNGSECLSKTLSFYYKNDRRAWCRQCAADMGCLVGKSISKQSCNHAIGISITSDVN